MSCACCKVRAATKKNTHFLTDAIIRTCLNVDGSSERDKGLYANMSNPSHAKIGFQRSTSPEKLEAEMKRPPNEEEIERAKKNPYSVDEVFCKQCEDLFTEIEDEFTKSILPKLREGDLSKKKELTFSEVKVIRLFAYLQIWRSAVCVPEFSLSPKVMEELRKFILDHKSVKKEELTNYPLSITFLQTLGGPEEFTKNYIAHLRLKNPYIIIMNDLIIQFFESKTELKPHPFYNVNEAKSNEFININEHDFKIRVMSNAERKTFLKAYTADIGKERIEFYGSRFTELWKRLTGSLPSQEIVSEYLYTLTKNDDESILNFTQEVVTKITTEFVADKLKVPH